MLPPRVGGTDALLAEAGGAALQAEKDAHRAEIHLLEQELLSYDARLGLLIAQYNRSQLELSRKESEHRRLQSGVNARVRRRGCGCSTESAEHPAPGRGKHPLLQAAAEENERLSQRLSELVGQTETLSVEQKKVRDLLAGPRPGLAAASSNNWRSRPTARCWPRC